MQEQLLHGKSGIKKIVGLEVTDNVTELFIQNDDGTVRSEFKNNKFWILTHTKLTPKSMKLNGSLHYQYGVQFDTRESFESARQQWKQDDIYSVWNSEEASMMKDGYTFYRDMKPTDLSIFSFDLETTGLNGSLNSGKVLIISTTFRNSLGVSINKLFTYDQYKTEKEMINAFCKYLHDCNPSVVTGHNIIGFDFPYLKARCEITGAKLKMGRDGSEVKFNRYDSKFRLDGTRDLLYKNITIYGREVVDTFFLVTSFDVGKTFESHALKPLIKQLGFEKEGRQYYDAGSIKDHYKNPTEWKKIKDYAESDAEDAIKLFDHMAPLYFNMCPMIPKPFSEILLGASGSKINSLLVRAYLQDKHSIPKATPTEAFQGALSFAVSGIYNNCFKIDIASLYPNIIVNYEVFDIDKDPKGYLLELVKSFKESRLKLKKLAAETGDPLYKQMDTTTKGILNSFFGFFSAAGLNFNSPECGSFITAKGRELLGVTIKWASGKDVSEFVKEEEEIEDAETA